MLKCTSLVHTVSSPLLKIKFIQNGSSLQLKPSGITYKSNLMHHCDHMCFILTEQDSSDYSSFRLEIFRHQQQVIHFSSNSKPFSINLITQIHFLIQFKPCAIHLIHYVQKLQCSQKILSNLLCFSSRYWNGVEY